MYSSDWKFHFLFSTTELETKSSKIIFLHFVAAVYSLWSRSMWSIKHAKNIKKWEVFVSPLLIDHNYE